MKRLDRWMGDSGIRVTAVFVVGGFMIIGLIFGVLVLIFGMPVDSQAQHRDECQQINGRFAAGGKYGDDICFMPDGRVFKVW